MIYVLVFPTLVLLAVCGVFIACMGASLTAIFQTNKYVPYFESVSQTSNTGSFTAICISYVVSIAGLVAGLEPFHPVMVMWYTILNVFTALYCVYVIDYYRMKNSGQLERHHVPKG